MKAKFTRFTLALVLPLAAHGQDTQTARLAVLNEQTIYRRAFEAVLWALPVADVLAPRRAGNERGVSPSAMFITEQRPTGKLGVVMMTAQSPSVFGDLTTESGPIVFEVPPGTDKAMFSGSIVDLWQFPLEEIGLDGADAGKGGKYLVLPPGYEGRIPEGYFVLRSRTYVINALFRAVPAESGDAGWAAAVAYAKTLKIYPLAEAAAPRPVAFADVSRISFPGTPAFDQSYFQYIDQLVQEEPVLAHNKAMMELLASLGIEKGKPFRPDQRTGRILDRAARDAQRDCIDRLISTKSVMTTGSRFWPDRHWVMPGINREAADRSAQSSFSHSLDYTTRAAVQYSGVGVPKRSRTQAICLLATVDSNGNPLDGSKHYKVLLPGEVPVNDFWEVIAYSLVTRGFIDTPANRIAVSSMNPLFKTSRDGSIEIDISPTAPAGRENNWISTRPGEPIAVCLRLHGAEKRILEKQWVAGDLTEVKGGT
jgi:hypothetical protein